MEISFSNAKKSLDSVRPIHYSKPGDFLEFYPDYSEENNAIGGWMKIIRPATNSQAKKELLGGHFTEITSKES